MGTEIWPNFGVSIENQWKTPPGDPPGGVPGGFFIENQWKTPPGGPPPGGVPGTPPGGVPGGSVRISIAKPRLNFNFLGGRARWGPKFGQISGFRPNPVENRARTPPGGVKFVPRNPLWGSGPPPDGGSGHVFLGPATEKQRYFAIPGQVFTSGMGVYPVGIGENGFA